MNGEITEPLVMATYCDDIRHEKGEKVSLMGCYQSELLLPQVPAVLAKLCAFVSVIVPLTYKSKTLSLHMFQDDKQIGQIDLPAETMTETLVSPADKWATRRAFNAAINMSPLVIERPCVIRVEATLNEVQLRGPRLIIRLANQTLESPPKSTGAKTARRSTVKPKKAA